MKSFNAFLTDYPSTNGRLFTSAVLCIIFVVTVLAGMILGRSIDSNVVWSIGTFLLVLSGLDATQFHIKRKTEMVTPPATSGVSNDAN